jgi:hypothetical protein
MLPIFEITVNRSAIKKADPEIAGAVQMFVDSTMEAFQGVKTGFQQLWAESELSFDGTQYFVRVFGEEISSQTENPFANPPVPEESNVSNG